MGESRSMSVDDWQPPVELPIVCRVCQTRYFAREDQIGQAIACPDCNVDNRVFPAPKPVERLPDVGSDVRLEGIGPAAPRLPGRDATQFRVVCRVCETMHYCLPKQAGEKIRCSDCGSIFTVPNPPLVKPKPKLRVESDIKVRPAAETVVHATNAGKLLAKAAEKYHEKQSLKPVPPKRPFRDKVWTLPFQLEVLLVYLVVCLIGCFVPVLVGLAVEGEGPAAAAGMVLMVGAGILTALTFLVVTNALMAITVSSSMGLTKIDYPKVEMFAYVMTAVYLFTSIVISVGPGVSLGAIIGSPWSALIALPFAFFVFPFVFLSMLDASNAAVPYTPYMASTLSDNRSEWIRFYVAALPAFFLIVFPQGAAVWYQSRAQQTQLDSMLPILVFSIAVWLSMFGVFVYFCLIGRLAWVIDQSGKVGDEANEGEKSEVAATGA